ncbi:protein phosphatase 2C domain-containing protein [Streptomyces monashensis]|uniref:PPM-type phosphatase domain-containing protein n=1 Tax=Streptomyces monashensis TaxID=1678012 RepID=A0A1S2PMJ6_9ACTN|nr:protein phosphatase 2C domain-containing protein [Streptomyces monashensis]OIJ94760.1 hypothetical protein BIV23_35730 [Streptomyces monashensis]
MSQQGGRPARPEDDWWGQLYDDSTADTGPTAAPDSLDDRFASAKNTVTEPSPGEAEDAASTRRTGRTGGAGGTGATGSANGMARREPALPAQRTTGPPATEPPATPAGPPPAAGDCAGADAVPAPADALPPWPPSDAALPEASAAPTAGWRPPREPEPAPAPVPDSPSPAVPPPPPSALDYVGSGPPTYDPEPTALPAAEPDALGELVADTVLDGARYGACTVRAVSLRGDSARFRGEPRRDALLTARFGTGERALVLVAVATGARATPGAHLAAAEACRWIGRAVGRSHAGLVEDIRAARRGELKSGLQRLADRSLGRLRASAAEQGVDPEEYTASLRCLLLPGDPDCRTRVFFGVGEGGLFRLRDGAWQDIEPRLAPDDDTAAAPLTSEGDRFTLDLGIPTPPSPYEPAPEPPREPFRFRAALARPGDALVMCSAGLAEPLRGEPALGAYLARRWSGRTPPGLAAFLADTQVRVKGYADDRTAAAVWEA